RCLFGQPLDTGADNCKSILAPARWAGRGQLLDMAALMAEQFGTKTMRHHPGIAIRAAEMMRAGTAKRQRRIAAPIQEEQHLLAPGEPRFCGLEQWFRNPAIAAGIMA